MESTNLDCCVGKLRTCYDVWYFPVGLTEYDFTYCEYCVKNGCNNQQNIYKIETGTIYACNCDCKNQENHKTLEDYIYILVMIVKIIKINII